MYYLFFLASLAFTMFLTHSNYGNSGEIAFWSLMTLSMLIQSIGEQIIEEIKNQKNNQ